MAKINPQEHEQVTFELRQELGEALKERFDDIKKTCEKYRICIKCFEPLPKGVYAICYCDYDEPR